MASACQPERPSCSLYRSLVELQEEVTKDVKAMDEQIQNRRRVETVGQIPYVLAREEDYRQSTW